MASIRIVTILSYCRPHHLPQGLGGQVTAPWDRGPAVLGTGPEADQALPLRV